MTDFSPEAFVSLRRTLAAPLLESVEIIWAALPRIHDFILQLGPTLPADEFIRRGEDIWVARDADLFDSAYLAGPCILDHGAQVRHCAFIRGNAIVGKGCVVGNSTELKNVILADGVQVPHYNYVGDSILGYKAHMGAGSITSNVKADRTPVTVTVEGRRVETSLRKLGAIVGDHVEIGCGAVLNPGSVIGRRTSIYPLSMVRGVIPADSIYKGTGEIVPRR